MARIYTDDEVKLIKHFINLGFTDKQVMLITKASQSYINRLRNNKLHVDLNYDAEEVKMPKDIESRFNTINTLLITPEMWGATITDEDIRYIHLLKFLGIPKEQVFDLYAHLPKSTFYGFWLKSDVDIRIFDSMKFGIKYEDYLDLIIDYFLRKR